jgi:hypothetical protein
MHAASSDLCSLCNTPIYPDDEIVSSGLDNYHYECHIGSDLPDPENEE